MPNTDDSIDTIQQYIISQATDETAQFITLDLKNTYSQLNSDPEKSRQLSFNIVSDEYTETCHLIKEPNGFNGYAENFPESYGSHIYCLKKLIVSRTTL